MHACIRSYSSRALSCRQTRQSVIVRWWGDDNAHVIQSVSQSAVSQTRRMCVLRSLSPAPADQPISKLICSRGQFHKVSCNSIQQTARKADCRHHGNVTGMENYTTDGKTWPEICQLIYAWFCNEKKHTGKEKNDVTPQTRRSSQPARTSRLKFTPVDQTSQSSIWRYSTCKFVSQVSVSRYIKCSHRRTRRGVWWSRLCQ